jgi:hypothetical protein
MTLTVKLPEQIERKLDIHCKKHHVTKSEVVTRVLARYLALQAPKRTPYELALKHGIIGCVSGGARDIGRDHSRFIKEKLRAKHLG